MYHSISNRDESHLRDYFKVCTAPEQFRRQMQTLQEHGYTGVDLETGLAGLERGAPPGTRPVAITFDDGFRDFHTQALPVLDALGFGATMYLPTALVGEPRQTFNGHECLTWAEVREARKSGIRFGSHTRTHPRLYELSWPTIEAELRDSRAELEDQLGEPIGSFAYPFAYPQVDREFCGRLSDALTASGYATCATTIVGRVAQGDHPYSLRRLPMNGADDASLLLAKLEGAYDWLAKPQAMAKRIGRFRRRTLRPGRVSVQ